VPLETTASTDLKENISPEMDWKEVTEPPPARTKFPQAIPVFPTMSSKWFYAHEGQVFGPTTAEHLKQLAVAGQLLPSDEVWKEGMTKRVRAEKVKGLFAAPLVTKSSEETTSRKKAPSNAANNSVLRWALMGAIAGFLFFALLQLALYQRLDGLTVLGACACAAVTVLYKMQIGMGEASSSGEVKELSSQRILAEPSLASGSNNKKNNNIRVGASEKPMSREEIRNAIVGLLAILVVVFGVLWVFGWWHFGGGNLTEDEFFKAVKVGITKKEVRSAVGKPDMGGGDTWYYHVRDPASDNKRCIAVEFSGDRVVRFIWLS
jgi:hypothetical protein